MWPLNLDDPPVPDVSLDDIMSQVGFGHDQAVEFLLEGLTAFSYSLSSLTRCERTAASHISFSEISSSQNYRAIALASSLSEVLEHLILIAKRILGCLSMRLLEVTWGWIHYRVVEIRQS